MSDSPATASAAAIPARPRPFLSRTLAAFTYRDFRVLWVGAFTSSVGTWMQQVAQSWIVLQMTGSAFFLGLAAFLGDVPILLFSLIGGVVADRRDRRVLLLTSQYLQMTYAFLLAGLISLGYVRVWHILVLSFLTGTAQAFGGPAYQALVPTLVDKDDLPNAIALNSIQFNLARVVGPLLAAAALAAFGAAACFGLNGLSFLVVIVCLYSLRIRHIPSTSSERMLEGLAGGFAFVRERKSLVALTFLAFASTFLGIPLLTLLPIFARDIFHQTATGYSVMMACSGVGAVVGALVVAALGNFGHKGRAALLMQVTFGLVIVGFAASRILWFSYLLLFLAGIALIAIFALVTSLVQLLAPNEMRGRVMSIYMVAFRGGMPLGSLITGYLARTTSAPAVLAVNGVLLAVVGGYLLFVDRTVKHL